MAKEFEGILPDVAGKIMENYTSSDILLGKSTKQLPARKIIIEILNDTQKILFPGYFSTEPVDVAKAPYYIGHRLHNLHVKMKGQLELALDYNDPDEHADKEAISQKAEEICNEFFEELPKIQSKLLLDAQAGYEGDPAASGPEEVTFSYPGFYATFVYRVAHELYKRNVPFVPRIMTEYAHSITGIDINSGAEIGEYFFMDHGTGIVIGETTVIGDYVKLYQGVTLGALSTRGGQRMSGVKRHPTIGDRVTIYSNASVLGGDTFIGDDSVIGGGAFITESVPANTRVALNPPEVSMKEPYTDPDNLPEGVYIYEI